MKKSIEVSSNIETLFGTRDENLHLLEDGLNVAIDLRSNGVEVEGAPRDVARAEQVFADYDHLQRSGFSFNNGDLNSMLGTKVFLELFVKVQPGWRNSRAFVDELDWRRQLEGLIAPPGRRAERNR